MFKKSLKTYLNNLVFVLIPLGCLCLALIVGGSILCGGVVAEGKTLISDVVGIVQDSQIEMEDLVFSVARSASELSWSNPLRMLYQLITTNWLGTQLNEIISTSSQTAVNFSDGINAAIVRAVGAIKGYFVTCAIAIIISVVVGFFVARCVVRKDAIKSKRFWLWGVLETAVFSLIFIGVVLLLAVWKYSFFITLLLFILLFALLTLAEAYAQDEKKIAFKNVVKFNNSRSLIVVDVILYAICVAVPCAVYAVGNIVAAAAVGYSLIAITMIVIGANGKLYVDGLCEAAATEQSEKLKTAKIEKFKRVNKVGKTDKTFKTGKTYKTNKANKTNNRTKNTNKAKKPKKQKTVKK